MRVKADYSVWPRTMPSGNIVYYYQSYDENGKRTVPRSTGKRTLTEATRECNRLMKLGLLVPREKIPTFEEYAVDWWDINTCEYCQWKAAREPLTSTTIKTNRACMEQHVLPKWGKYKLDEITQYDIESWMLEMTRNGYKNTYVNNQFFTLRIMLGDVVRRGILKVNPAEKIKKLARNSKKIEILKIPEVRKLFPLRWETVWENKYVYMANKLAAYTGMRIGEIMGLRSEYVFPEYIAVRGQINSERVYTQTKTKVDRDIPITAGIYNDLKGLMRINGNGYVFSGNGGERPITHSAIYNGMCGALEKIGINHDERIRRGLSFHAWRHFLITFLRMSDVSDKKAKEVAGHSSAFVNDQYTHLDTREFEDVREVQEKLLIAPKKKGGAVKADKKQTRGKAAVSKRKAVKPAVAGKGVKPKTKKKTA
jgi:integrase